MAAVILVAVDYGDAADGGGVVWDWIELLHALQQ